MRYIVVPDDVVLRPSIEILGVDPNAKPETLSFRKFAVNTWLNDVRAIEGGFVKQVRWAKVVALFDGCQPKQTLVLEDEDYSTLRTIVDTPRTALPVWAMIQCLAFSRAVIEAADKEPVAA